MSSIPTTSKKLKQVQQQKSPTIVKRLNKPLNNKNRVNVKILNQELCKPTYDDQNLTGTMNNDNKVQLNLKTIQYNNVSYIMSGRGNKLLIHNGQRYIKNSVHGTNIYWKCTKWHIGCKARAITSYFDPYDCTIKNVHTHDQALIDTRPAITQRKTNN